LTLAQAEVTSKPADVGARRMAALAQLYVGLALKLANRYPAALDAFRKGLEGFRALSAADPADTGLRRSIMVLSLQAGMVQLLQEQTTQALASFRDGLLVANELSAREPTNAQLQRDVAICYSNIGDAQLRQRDSSGAEQSFRIATRLLRKLAVDDPASPNPRIWEASSLRDLGNVLLAQGQAVAGRRQLAEAVGILEPIVASRGFDVTARGQLAETYSALGSSHQAGRRSGALEARSWYGKAQSIYFALRQEGKLAPIYATRLSEVNEKIAALSK
jgi:tetratricopeptide (TPR) repeat protein